MVWDSVCMCVCVCVCVEHCHTARLVCVWCACMAGCVFVHGMRACRQLFLCGYARRGLPCRDEHSRVPAFGAPQGFLLRCTASRTQGGARPAGTRGRHGPHCEGHRGVRGVLRQAGELALNRPPPLPLSQHLVRALPVGRPEEMKRLPSCIMSVPLALCHGHGDGVGRGWARHCPLAMSSMHGTRCPSVLHSPRCPLRTT
jgi:hypothetical protein